MSAVQLSHYRSLQQHREGLPEDITELQARQFLLLTNDSYEGLL
jgi:hypothetical protein